MTRIAITTLTLALLACAGHALAAESTSSLIRAAAPKGITDTFYACIDKADSNDIDEAACLSQERSRQDKRLNLVYKELLGKLGAKQKTALVDAERAWLKSRESDGTFEASLYGDEPIDNLESTESEIFALCARANTLQKYLSIANGR